MRRGVKSRRKTKQTKRRKKKLNQDLEFESILYVPEEAWNLKHKDDLNEYEYIPKYNYESRSNIDLW